MACTSRRNKNPTTSRDLQGMNREKAQTTAKTTPSSRISEACSTHLLCIPLHIIWAASLPCFAQAGWGTQQHSEDFPSKTLMQKMAHLMVIPISVRARDFYTGRWCQRHQMFWRWHQNFDAQLSNVKHNFQRRASKKRSSTFLALRQNFDAPSYLWKLLMNRDNIYHVNVDTRTIFISLLKSSTAKSQFPHNVCLVWVALMLLLFSGRLWCFFFSAEPQCICPL